MSEQNSDSTARVHSDMYFNANELGPPSESYVCWIDVMGSKNHVSQSIKASANFIFKLHCAVLIGLHQLNSTNRDGISIYPVMDGAFITSTTRNSLESLLKSAMKALSDAFVQADRDEHKFLVRAAIAFGRVYHGRELTAGASSILDDNRIIRNSVLLGLPMVLAYEAERTAPPFGVAVDRSARAMSSEESEPYQFAWWKWFRTVDDFDLSGFAAKIDGFFEWHSGRYWESGYAKEAIERHREMARQYLV